MVTYISGVVLLLSILARTTCFTPNSGRRALQAWANNFVAPCDSGKRVRCYNFKWRGGAASDSVGAASTSPLQDDGSETTSTTSRGVRRDPSLAFERVKNIRDLSSVKGSGIVPGRVFRTGYLSEATKADVDQLRNVTGLRTLIDIRSSKEVERDELLHADIYRGFVNIGGYERRDLCAGGGGEAFWDDEAEGTLLERGTAPFVGGENGGRRRYFISLIDESLYKKGVFQRLRKRQKVVVMALAPAMKLSKRCTKKARGIFLREINAGGLVLLNQLLLQYSGAGINRVLRLMATRERHPVALYCTAGKDRTGLVMALALAVLGVSESAIIDDYAESDAAYRELNDRDAMVGALAQEELDPDTFLCAPRHVMQDILRYIEAHYGSVDDYLDSIGFDASWRDRLRQALQEE